MSKIHITLVGGQTMPVFSGIINDDPDKIILICSNDSKKEASRIENAVKSKNNKWKKKIWEKILFDPYDINKIFKKIKESFGLKDQNGNYLKDEFGGYLYFNDKDEITLNLTSGTKPWSILFDGQMTVNNNVKSIYIDQQNRIWNIKEGTFQSITHRVTMEDMFLLNGIKIQEKTDFEEYDKSDIEALKEIRSIREINHDAFNEVTTDIYKIIKDRRTSENQKQIIQLKSNAYEMTWDKLQNKFYGYIKNKKESNIKRFNITSKHIRSLMLNTGWFEFEVAKLINEWDIEKKIYLNCILKRSESGNSNPLNEIDIIVQTKDKFLFIECKTQVAQPTDVDKFNNAVKQYSGLQAHRIFFTDDRMKQTAVEKCESAGIFRFTMESLKTNGIIDEKKKEIFFEKLNNIIKSANTK